MAKFTLEFSDQAAKIVRKLADEHETSQSEIVRKAVNLMNFVDEERRAGNHLLVQTPDGRFREIVPV